MSLNFLKEKNEKSYYEIHLSPNLDRNIHNLSYYPSPLERRNDLEISESTISTEKNNSWVHLKLSFVKDLC